MYGKEMILDLHECDKSLMTQETLEIFFKELCSLIDMERVKATYWIEDEGMDRAEYDANPHLQGVSAVQFIKTSNITVHTISGLGNVYINIFSCKDFDARLAEGFSIGFFDGKKMNCIVLDRV